MTGSGEGARRYNHVKGVPRDPKPSVDSPGLAGSSSHELRSIPVADAWTEPRRPIPWWSIPRWWSGVSCGQYPGGQYPGGQYLTQSPGTINVPTNKKSSDKSSSKQDSNSTKVTLRAVDGTLRQLGENDLYLETSSHKILKFRMLAKTQFHDKQGEQIRDSLLKSGDQLAVQVPADDPETAVRVILNRSGTEAERTAAARPFDRESAKVAVASDTHSAGSMSTPGGSRGGGRGPSQQVHRRRPTNHGPRLPERRARRRRR